MDKLRPTLFGRRGAGSPVVWVVGAAVQPERRSCAVPGFAGATVLYPAVLGAASIQRAGVARGTLGLAHCPAAGDEQVGELGPGVAGGWLIWL